MKKVRESTAEGLHPIDVSSNYPQLLEHGGNGKMRLAT
jgi:hypothetical protein